MLKVSNLSYRKGANTRTVPVPGHSLTSSIVPASYHVTGEQTTLAKELDLCLIEQGHTHCAVRKDAHESSS